MIRVTGPIHQHGAHLHRWCGTRWLRLGLIVSALVIVGADAAFHGFKPGVVVAGVLDEPAHAATTIIILGALGWRNTRAFGVAAVVASVAIDLDHIPQYLGAHFLTAGTARPYPHSFLTLLVVVVIAVLRRGRARALALGAELGLVGHLFRDMAEPSSKAGVPLFWPVSDVNVRVPYALYACVMVGLLLVALYKYPERRGGSSRRCHEPGADPVLGANHDQCGGDYVGDRSCRQTIRMDLPRKPLRE